MAELAAFTLNWLFQRWIKWNMVNTWSIILISSKEDRYALRCGCTVVIFEQNGPLQRQTKNWTIQPRKKMKRQKKEGSSVRNKSQEEDWRKTSIRYLKYSQEWRIFVNFQNAKWESWVTCERDFEGDFASRRRCSTCWSPSCYARVNWQVSNGSTNFPGLIGQLNETWSRCFAHISIL